MHRISKWSVFKILVWALFLFTAACQKEKKREEDGADGSKSTDTDTSLTDTGADLNNTDTGPEVSTDFIIEHVEGGEPCLRGAALAASPAGVVAIAEERGRYLYLVELENGEEVSRALVDRFVRWPALVADSSGHYHLAYWNGLKKAVVYATNTSGEWATQEIHATICHLVMPRIALGRERRGLHRLL
jgi:hypothetical protein